ncbi:FkbH-like protein [Streptacidiphilus sp. MAP12-20]|uniref:HAD-IIIC family phosphatase n=1 Tax=Streptacidiphilus sp. MAP12-20 TaxID=3156299 RepID=UPI003511339C
MADTITATAAPHGPVAVADTGAAVKAVVWDLDNTLWDGVLLEGGGRRLRPGVERTVRALDARGVLQSVASRNDPEAALAQLTHFRLADYFLVPQIGWGAKSASVNAIAQRLNLHPESFLFIDDDPFERAEVSQACPQVRIWDPADDVTELLGLPQFDGEVTADAAVRRLMYKAALDRDTAERDFAGTAPQFLASLGLRLTVRRAGPDDLARAEELTVRTHQLNATGYTYSAAELDALRGSGTHAILVAELSDRFGDYGTVAVVMVEQVGRRWTLKLLLASCRVMSRGVGGMLLAHVVERARAAGACLYGEFVPTDRNRQMLVAYRFAGFRRTPAAGDRGVLLLEHDGATVPAVPGYVRLHSDF